jgi:hypothetical protein
MEAIRPAWSSKLAPAPMRRSGMPADREMADLVPGPERDRDGGAKQSEMHDVREHGHETLPCPCVVG